MDVLNQAESGLVFYRKMLREMKIAVPKWLDTVSREVTKKRKVFNPFQPSGKGGFIDVRKRGYHFGAFGNIVRSIPKRDKSISARQSRIRRNQSRHAQKLVTLLVTLPKSGGSRLAAD